MAHNGDAQLDRSAQVLEAERALLLERTRTTGHDCGFCARALVAGTTALLPCQHTVHRACVMADVQQGVLPVRCRECGTPTDTVAADTDVVALPSSPAAEARLASPVACLVCLTDVDEADRMAAAYQCTECHDPHVTLCEVHAPSHRLHRASRGHRLERLVDEPARLGRCDMHPDHVLDVYCVECDRPVCRLCAVSVCKAHKTPALSVHLPVLRSALAAARDDGAAFRARVEIWLARATLAADDVAVHAVQRTAEIRALYATLRATLQEREEGLCRAIAEAASAESSELRAWQEEGRLLWLAVHGAEVQAAALLRTDAAESPTLPLHLGLLASKTTAHLRAMAARPVPPTPTSDTVTLCIVPDNLDSVLREAGRLEFSKAYGPRSVVHGPGLLRAYPMVSTECIITTATRAGVRKTTGGDPVRARIIGPVPSAAAAREVAATIADNQDGTYTLGFTVAAMGTHVLDVDVHGVALAGSPFVITATAPISFRYSGGAGTPQPAPYENRGVLYWLGTARGAQPWRNPHDLGVVRVTLSSNSGSSQVGRLVAHVPPQASRDFNLWTDNVTNSWMAVELLGGGVRVRPTGYMISTDGYGAGGSYHVRNWVLQGSDDGRTWTTLRAHSNDATLSKERTTAYFAIEGVAPGAYYAHLRVLQTGKNATGTDHLTATSLEVYGDVII
jgi:hypothetical protein